MKVAYKIVIRENKRFRTLYHGNQGKRYLTTYTWLEADKKMVRDGSGGKEYLSGFHCFKHRLHAAKYLKRFSAKIKGERVIITCRVQGVRQKPTNKQVYLADRIMLVSMSNYNWGKALEN